MRRDKPKSTIESATSPRDAPDADFFVVGIGASAGGLEACRLLLQALEPDRSMALIVIQHLDPTQRSLLAELLASHTGLVVRDAAEGMAIEPGHCYVLPPGNYLSVGQDMLHLSRPLARHGARLPFDFLLHSLAQAYGARAIGIVLSGTGSDGSAGIRDIRLGHGYVIVQDPNEAQYDGMPRSAIATGNVDAILPIAAMPAALAAHATTPVSVPAATNQADDPFHQIVELLRNRTAHDFSLYKHGTLRRRIERRVGLAGMPRGALGQYHDLVETDPLELEALAQDLLINVTSFFRDPKVFETVRTTVIPALMADRNDPRPVRIWIAGCSTGEETYSLAMLFQEWADDNGTKLKLQIFASDVDSDAIARARNGLYPATIEDDVGAARLARFFSREETHYRISRDLRALVVFTVHDLLADPPFSRLDMISCRNLMIYLQPEAQSKVIAQFRFALRDGGVLLLGSAETLGQVDQGFEVISKTDRLFRRVGPARVAGAITPPARIGAPRLPRNPLVAGPMPQAPRQTGIADLCRRLVIEAFAPAAVLINRGFEYLFSLGPTERYLRVAPGLPTFDLIAMARPSLRTTLRSAIQRAIESNARIIAPGGTIDEDGRAINFHLDIQPVARDGEALLLVCFIEDTGPTAPTRPPRGNRNRNLTVVERELAATRTELLGAIRDLELSSEDQKAINEEALSVNEEFQSTNEELLTSKEELQSLNEELTALNGQLQETLERQRITGNDLQNILYSTDVATLFLDTDLNIRFFTPASRRLFNIIATDIGRPLTDLTMLAEDDTLSRDAQAVLLHLAPIEREILTTIGKGRASAWLIRRITSYRTHEDRIEGVVITFTDITDRKTAAEAVQEARLSAERADAAKSRFLAAASHDLRQPLQTLALLQGLLARAVADPPTLHLIERLDQTIGTMTGMLDTLLDINQIETGVMQANIGIVALDPLFTRINADYACHAEAAGLGLSVVPCRLSVRTDAALLEQILRNLVSNAIKYSKVGRVLIGCRRQGDAVRIEVWDTGLGIAETQLDAIFEEYHQLDNAARERSRGLGLGLSIVRRLAQLLHHPLRVRSVPGKGSVFSIEVPRADAGTALLPVAPLSTPLQRIAGRSVLIIEDDAELRDLLARALAQHDILVTLAPDGPAALARMAHAGLIPDLILTDYNLPQGMTGVAAAQAVLAALHTDIPVLILTGDIATTTLRDIAAHGYVRLSKPVSKAALLDTIATMLDAPIRPAQESSATETGATGRLIGVIEDDDALRGDYCRLLETEGFTIADYSSAEAFLASCGTTRDPACLLIDAGLPGMSGIDLLERLHARDSRIPALVITGDTDTATAVAAMRAGATDFVTKPVAAADLLGRLAHAIDMPNDRTARDEARDAAQRQLAILTPRQRDILAHVLVGRPTKSIATALGISTRTVEAHRAAIMRKLKTTSLPAIARMAVIAECF
ncbi:CheR family methyltransferase [Acidiphilium acidophilum]|uniref:histidine kinase n=1 Tax=Acidiphilium acidophilum TaxID=76588 RepID=A0AAW9DVR7_ACIAO|nr:CheR family methyltransferase [Acidiphilium acidophilum]MDX5932976.1 CheR family methyltransferase [Acidiphilium acidophilum]